MPLSRSMALACCLISLGTACAGSPESEPTTAISEPTASTVARTVVGSTSTTLDIASEPILVFVRQDTEDDNTDLYMLDENGNETRLTEHEAFDEYPAVSPDGTMVTFDSFRTGDWETFVIDVDGTDVRRLTDSPGEDGFTSWAPDGGSVALDSERDGDFEIYVLEIEGGSITKLTDNGAWDGEPAWSPDGSRIAFHSDRDGDGIFDLFSMSPDGTGQERLTENGFSPAWSPDGSAIAFAKEPEEGGDRDLWVLDVETGDEQLIAGGDAWDDEPAWSPDGSRLYFSSDRDGPFQIYSMNPDGSDVELVVGGDRDTFSPAFVPSP